MAISDSALIEVLINEDTELRETVEQHKVLDSQILTLDRRRFLTPQEQLERKQLQKMKLIRKDRIVTILSKYRKNERVVF